MVVIEITECCIETDIRNAPGLSDSTLPTEDGSISNPLVPEIWIEQPFSERTASLITNKNVVTSLSSRLQDHRVHLDLITTACTSVQYCTQISSILQHKRQSSYTLTSHNLYILQMGSPIDAAVLGAEKARCIAEDHAEMAASSI